MSSGKSPTSAVHVNQSTQVTTTTTTYKNSSSSSSMTTSTGVPNFPNDKKPSATTTGDNYGDEG